MFAESSGNSNAVGDTQLAYYKNNVKYGESYGCFQIRYLEGRPDKNYLLDATNNVSYAYSMYKTHGWTPWSVYNNGNYKEYL